MADSSSFQQDVASRSNVNPVEDTSSPFYLHHSENHISIRNKQGFLDGSIVKPSPEDSTYLPWIRCNNLIVAWLLRSISPPIASTMFSQPDDSRICHLQHLLCTITQGTKSVDAYFTELNGVWEELRNFRPFLHCSCGKCNQECFQRFVEVQQRDYVFKFLNELNETYQGLRSQIILMKPFPTLDQVYNMLLCEET
ncbi:hypothetical protein P3X46_006960 [Hevea brasiliensis]|uniref:Retrotransposon gag domain-containing protein n=1 Tax=Hevea brasiliensis TaxID=3981 RepID=A0ABQ9MSC2_HEVBR|nr:hypothetical protein P3X46_006960 [Hevea brasiliensis]